MNSDLVQNLHQIHHLRSYISHVMQLVICCDLVKDDAIGPSSRLDDICRFFITASSSFNRVFPLILNANLMQQTVNRFVTAQTVEECNRVCLRLYATAFNIVSDMFNAFRTALIYSYGWLQSCF